MNAALIRKTFRDARLLLLLAALAVAGFEVVFILAVEDSLHDIDVWIRRVPEFARRLVNTLAGANLFENLTPTGVMSIGFSHPVVHVCIWAFTITLSTRVLAGEVDNGTADLLLSLPVSRAGVYVSVSVVGCAAGVALAAAPWVGTWFAQRVLHRGPFQLDRLAQVAVNLLALYLAVGAGALCLSAAGSRRGRAVGVIVAVLVGSFVLNFLAAIWSPARSVAFLGVLNYYQPLPIIAGGQWPVRHLAVLLLSAATFWTAGLVVFARRDIRTT